MWSQSSAALRATRVKLRTDAFATSTRGKEATMEMSSVVKTLNRIMELELAGVVRYTHYALMVYGYGRIPIVSWLNAQADESLLHARQAGELVTALGGHPSLRIGSLLETHRHDIGE